MTSGLTRRTLLRGVLAGAAVGSAAACDDGSAPRLGVTPEPTPVTLPTGTLTFPPGFGWGAATSAYQVEGAVRADGRGVSIWDTFSHTPGRTRNGDTGDVAADHYHRYAQDVALMRELGLTSYRFSIAWPRILPHGTGTPNQKGLDFYRRLVDALRAAGIAPMVTLFHWDLPQALQDKGGWENRDCAEWFAEYASVCFRALNDVVPVWLTINEPKTIVDVGYTYGVHAPGKRDPRAAWTALHHLLLAHGMAVKAYRDSGGAGRIGPALNLAPAYPADGTHEAAAAARYADGMENRRFLDPILRGDYPSDVVTAEAAMRKSIRDGDLGIISTPIDLLAVQYYNPVYVSGGGEHVTLKPTSDASWQQIYPEGLYDVLVRVKRDYGDIPIVITENGRPRADELVGGKVNDPERIAFLRDHLAAAHLAIQAGVRLESYHLWSLLDNYEWAEGYGQRWGIVYVDYPTQRRIPKASAEWYKGVIATNTISR